MEPDEVLLFTGYGSASADGWKVGHGAFDNRRTHPHGLPRVSFEARFCVFRLGRALRLYKPDIE
jgi:hypothetical protein